MTANPHPNGKTCGDCVYFKHCAWLLQQKPTATQCDWIPSRFEDRSMRFVRKGYLRYHGLRSKPIHVIVDDHGFIFGAGLGGWQRLPEYASLKLLPGEYAYDYWRHEQWWTGTWKCPEWAWIYGQ